MITVVIPALNEGRTIAQVVRLARNCPQVDEVLVIDDGSIDETPRAAAEAGATVVTSTMLGKGASMQDGVLAARQELIVFLDGDLTGIRPDVVARMAEPLLKNRADFVKARFARAGGRVTTLTAKPLLRTFFPELATFDQPLGGVIAARRSLLRNLSFETDYGVDVGLFIDAAVAGARLEEVDIGPLEHDSQPLDVLGDMATQVVRAILDRAARYQRFSMTHVREVQEVERRMQAEMAVVLDRLGPTDRLALLDMDGVLLDGRFIVTLAERTNRVEDLRPLLDNHDLPAEERTRRIAAVFAGVRAEEFEAAARVIPLVQGASPLVIHLRRAGYRVGLVTDSFHIAAETVRRRAFADFTIAHVLRFRRSEATGEVLLAPAMLHERGCLRHACCKRNALEYLVQRMGVPPERVLAIGDSDNDLCMLEAAATSVAFRPKSLAIRDAASHVIERSLLDVLGLIGGEHSASRAVHSGPPRDR